MSNALVGTTTSRPRKRLGSSRAQKEKGRVRREAIMKYLVMYKRAHDGVSPTLEEIAVAVGLQSKSTVNTHLRTLQREGRLELAKNGIMVVGGNWEFQRAGADDHISEGPSRFVSREIARAQSGRE